MSLTAAIAHQRAFIEQHLHRLFHEKRIALGAFDDEALEWRQLGAVAEHRRQHFLGALVAERVEPQLRVVGLAAPLMRYSGR